jgi:Holliday junction resolvase RusA-like endonuclease
LIKFTVDGRLPTLNEYTRASRGNKYASASLKRDTEDIIIAYIRKTLTGECKPPYFITFRWYEDSKRRDKDNVCFAKKFILDALQTCGVIENDSNKYISGFRDLFYYGNEQKVVIEIEGGIT